MRKWMLVALATGAMVMLQRRASRMGFPPALLLTAAAEKVLGLLTSQPAGPKPPLWRRFFPKRANPDPPADG